MNIFKPIQFELKAHWPFTLLGASSGILLMMAFNGMDHETAHSLFRVFHSGHVVFSAIVITAMFRRYTSDQKGPRYFGIFLFLAVWIPCGVSDIAFPLLFIPKDRRKVKCYHS